MNTSEQMQIDTLSRDKISKEIEKNFFVEAGAGSGKTTMLVQRMVAMVEAGVDVRKICAITFTKAAAGEFYARFQKKLAQANTPRCLAALNDIDLCFMGTIDSFCNMILSEHPARAGIPSNSCVLSEGDMQKVYKEAYTQIQRGLYGAELQQLCKRFQQVQKNGLYVFANAIGTFMDTRNCKYQFDAVSEQSIDQSLAEEKAHLRKIICILLEKPELVYTKNKDSVTAYQILQEKQKILFDTWDGHLPEILGLLKAISQIRLWPNVDLSVFGLSMDFFESYGKEGKVKWFQFAPQGLCRICDTLCQYQYAVSMEFLSKSSLAIAATLKKEGKLTFFDYLLYLRDLLKEDALQGGDLIRHIYERHSYFLIDEFQDTNPMQAEVFFYLTAEEPKGDWRACVPRPGSLFIVGDPKQSIYRFRYADVSAFLKVRALFAGNVGEVLHLTRNFRSTYGIRQWFNKVFTELLPEDTDNQCKYDLIPLEAAPQPDGTFEGVYTYSVPSKAQNEEEKDHNQVVSIIQTLVGSPDIMIQEPGDSAPRRVTYRDIMLITPGKGKLSQYISAFNQAEIPCKVEGKVVFSECPALLGIATVFCAISNRDDARFIYSALTSPVFNIPLETIQTLKCNHIEISLYHEADLPEGEAITKAVGVLRKLCAKAKQMSATGLYMAILEELDLFNRVSTDNLESVYYALELLRAKEISGAFASLRDAALFLEGLTRNETDSERTISLTDNENRVHIANLHKVKGLEAPIVILGNPSDKNNNPSVRVEQGETQPNCWIFCVPGALKGVDLEEEQLLEADSLDAERNRLLYVAATRARRALIVADKVNKDGKRLQNRWMFFAERAQKEFFKTFSPIVPAKKIPVKWSAESLYEAGAQQSALRNKDAVHVGSYEIMRPSHAKVKSKLASEDDFDDFASEDAARVRTRVLRTDANIVGTMVHRLMENLVSSRNQVDLDALCREIAGEYEAFGKDYTSLLKKVGLAEQSGTMVQTLLAADEVYCELPFCRRAEADGTDVLWHGIMDVVYRQGNQWFIVDYKTNWDDSDLDVRYRQQLRAYEEAFFELTGNAATATTYHIEVV